MVFLSLWVFLCVVSILDKWSSLLVVVVGRVVTLVIISARIIIIEVVRLGNSG